jgi:hypothetical protein
MFFLFKRCEQPPTIIFALPQDYGSLLLSKLADPTSRGLVSASDGKVMWNQSYKSVPEAAGSLQGACGGH